MHILSIQGGDAVTKLKPPRNDFFDHWNQSRKLYEDCEATDALTLTQHASSFFLNPFLIIKILKWPHPNQLIKKKNDTNTL